MLHDKKGLRLLNGLRPSALTVRANRTTWPSQRTERSSVYRESPGMENTMDTLRAMEQRLSALLEDRTHIGRDLHDCILQSLYALGLNIEAGWRGRRHTTPESEQTHAHTIEQINRLIHDIRQMIHGLDEGVVQEFDLMTELQTLKSVYDQIGHVRISLDLHPAAIEVLTKEEEREILSIAREALSNCVRHARAAHAAISIRRRGDRIRLQISDDGRGFATGDGRPQGYGLANMTARAKKIGGTLRIQSEEGRGTDIIAEFLLEPILTPV
jgi:two-component system NarL family sensor kinase